jgi:hypothetical protein
VQLDLEGRVVKFLIRELRIAVTVIRLGLASLKFGEGTAMLYSAAAAVCTSFYWLLFFRNKLPASRTVMRIALLPLIAILLLSVNTRAQFVTPPESAGDTLLAEYFRKQVAELTDGKLLSTGSATASAAGHSLCVWTRQGND